MMPELDAEQALTFTENALETNALSNIPMDMAPLMASLLLSLTEIGKSDCQCDGCVRIRETLENFGG